MVALLLSACLVVAPVDGDGDGYSREDGDCDDVRSDIHPGAVEICDDIDNDCDDLIDDEDAGLDWSTAPSWFIDTDGDGYGTDDQPTRACFWASGLSENGGDCDDGDSTVHPSADELCGGGDEDCDGLLDAADDSLSAASMTDWYRDADGDGYGDPEVSVADCEAPAGHVVDGSDCNDADAYQSPAAGEWVDSIDNDCDGLIDNHTNVFDDDGDCRCEEGECIGSVNTGCSGLADGDCDDDDEAISPDADEYCDALDNDCDGETDEADAVDVESWYWDVDGDGYGVDGAASVAQCTAPAGYGVATGDCDDGNAAIYPGAAERCDSIDSDCDGTTDDGDEEDAPTWYSDSDDDGYGDDSTAVVDCTSPPGDWVTEGGDCDDGDPSQDPSQLWYPDQDGDSYGDMDATPATCEPDASTDVPDGTDCDDGDADTHPDAEEVRADGLDQDCDGLDVTWEKIVINADDAACGLDSSGSIDCWGDDDDGEVKDAPSGDGYLDVALGNDHACAVAFDGYVECWGEDTYDQAWPPTTVRFTALAAGLRSTCGIRQDTSRALCWGEDDDSIVTGEPSYSLTAIEGSRYGYCGLDSSGRLRCWGSGDGVTEAPSSTGFTDFSMDYYSGCALDGSGDVTCWGDDELIDDVPDGGKYGPFVAVGSSIRGGCVIDSSARLLCWASSYLSSEPSGSYEALVLAPYSYTQACAIDTSGGLSCWGYSGNVISDAP